MDAITLALIKSMAKGGGGGGGGSADDIVLDATWGETYPFINITTDPLPSMADVQKCFETGGKVFLHIGTTTTVALSGVEKTSTQFDYYSFTGRGFDYDGNIKIFYVVLYDDDGVTSDHAYAVNDRKFIVTLTPTALDYSGTMDKTPEEITDAYNAGQEIELYMPSMSLKTKATMISLGYGLIRVSAIATYWTGSSHVLIEILTSAADSTYQTFLYALTPAS